MAKSSNSPDGDAIEREILRAMFQNTDIRQAALSTLDPLLFRNPMHKAVFAKLTGEERAINNGVLAEDFAKRRLLGLQADLTYFITGNPLPSDTLGAYYRLLRENGAREALQEVAQTIEEKLRKNVPSEEITTETLRLVHDISSASMPFHNPLQPVDSLAIPAAKQFDYYAEKRGVTGIPTGLPNLDSQIAGLNPGIIVVGSRPYLSMSQFALNLVAHAAKKHNVLYMSRRSHPVDLTKSLTRIIAEIDQRELANPQSQNTDSSFKALIGAAGIVKNLKLWFTKGATTPLEVYNQAAFAKRRNGLDLLLIDSFQDFTRLAPENNYRDAPIIAGAVAQTFDSIASDLNIPVVLLCQLTGEGETKVRSKRPYATHLRDFGALEYLAREVLLLHPEREDEGRFDEDLKQEKVTLYIESSPTRVGKVPLNYNRDSGTFIDPTITEEEVAYGR